MAQSADAMCSSAVCSHIGMEIAKTRMLVEQVMKSIAVCVAYLRHEASPPVKSWHLCHTAGLVSWYSAGADWTSTSSSSVAGPYNKYSVHSASRSPTEMPQETCAPFLRRSDDDDKGSALSGGEV